MTAVAASVHAMRREAVDAQAKAYWTKYFGPYGKQWTDAIPRRVASAMAEELKKSAAKDTPAAALTGSVISPLGFAKTKTGGLKFEGVFRGLAANGTVHRMFCAEFAPDGQLLGIKSREAA